MRRLTVSVLAIAALFFALPLVAGEEGGEGAGMMPEHTQPGEHHEHLGQLVGEYTYTSKMWMQPDAAPMESSGECSRRMVLGNRYMHETFTGDFMGMPFKGMAVTGFSRQEGHYFTMWFDNFGTGVMQGTGSCSEGGKWAFSGESLDPMTGEPMKFRETLEIVDGDTQVFSMYVVNPDGSEFKNMEITLKRKAS